MIAQDADRWKAFCHSVRKHAVSRDIHQCKLRAWRRDLSEAHSDAGSPEPILEGIGPQEAQRVYCCYDCGMPFMSQRAWTIHRRSAHGAQNLFKAAVGEGTVCNACLTQFHTPQCLLHHISFDSHGCRDTYHDYLLNHPARGTTEHSGCVYATVWRQSDLLTCRRHD